MVGKEYLLERKCSDAALKVTTESLSRGNVLYICVYLIHTSICTSAEAKIALALLHSSYSSYLVMNPLEKPSYIFSLVCCFFCRRSPWEEVQWGRRTAVDTVSFQVSSHSSHAFRAQINLVRFNQQIIKKLSIINYISSKRLLKCFIDSTRRPLHRSLKASTSGMKCNNCSTGHGRGEEVRNTSTSNCNCRGNLGRKNVITLFGAWPDHGG